MYKEVKNIKRSILPSKTVLPNYSQPPWYTGGRRAVLAVYDGKRGLYPPGIDGFNKVYQ